MKTMNKYLSNIWCIIALLFTNAILWYIPFPFDETNQLDGSLLFGAIHVAAQFIAFSAFIISVIYTLVCLSSIEDHPKIPFSKWFIILPIICLSIGHPIYKGFVLYNQHIQYQSQLEQKEQERMLYFDKMWKTYLSKYDICQLNRETFIEVTAIIMENRADGLNTSWKWVKENQQIPYEEFSSFYADLSKFVYSQREGYFKIEQECMELVREHNIMLDVYPNKFYNLFINIPKLKYNYGFISDKTLDVFKSRIENV